jgi:hypothetical protein
MRKLVALGLLLAVAPAASAMVIIQDDFESYVDTASLSPPWVLTVGTVADSYLDTTDNGPTWPGVQCVTHVQSTGTPLEADRRDNTSFAPFEVTGSQYLVWAFDYEDTVGSASDPRQYGQLLAGSAGLSELISMGQYNAAAPVHDPNKYQARVAFGGPGWFNLNTNRSVGWHRFEARIYANYVDFYVDGLPDTLGVPQAGGDWYNARIGSGLSTAGGAASYDNYLLELVPEPGSLFLLALGGLAVLRRR